MRLNPTNVQNVVTYNVVIDVSNPEQKLKPGMTANLVITIDERNNVLKVPNSALRFTPLDANGQKLSGGGNGSGQGRGQNANSSPQANNANAAANASGSNNAQPGAERKFAPANAPVLDGQTRAIWVLGADGKPQSRRIKVGLTDGASTEVVEGNLQEGEMVITGQTITAASKAQGTASPAPGFGGAPRTGGAGGTGGRRN
jgi:HlyD family secretion protein